MVLCNAAFTQGNMYCMVLWLYIYMYGPRSVPQKGNFVKQLTQQKVSIYYENVFIFRIKFLDSCQMLDVLSI